jgi:uncharacterized protein (UPF0276 family)
MKLGLNYSPQAADLLRSGQITIERFKCPPWPDVVAAARQERPPYLHFALNTGDGSIDAADWQAIENGCAETDTPYINLHLVATAEQFPHIPPGSHAPAHLNAVTEALLKDVVKVKARFGRERVILENVVYRGSEGPVLYACVAPEVIRRVVNETGCGLLLDTAHARMTCLTLGGNPQEYVARLPVERLREWHITGIQPGGPDGKLRDSMPMGDDDWSLVAWCMAQIESARWPQPWIASLEYGGVGPKFEWRSEPDVLAAQVPRLRQLLGLMG